MRNRTAVLGLLALAAMIAAAIVFLPGMFIENPGAGAVGGSASTGAAPDVPCSSCDARHKRLQKGQSGKD